MINLLWKMALVIMTINGLFFFVGSCEMNETNKIQDGSFNFLPASLIQDRNGGKCVSVVDTKISSVNQVKPNEAANPTDRNSEVTSGSTGSSQAVPYYDTTVNLVGFLYDFVFNLMFGYIIWLQALGLPMAFVAALAVPLFIIQAIGLFYLLTTFLNAAGIAVGLVRG